MTVKQLLILRVMLVSLLSLAIHDSILAQKNQMVRIAKIEVASQHLSAYQQALKLQMQTAIANEPGVLSYHAVADKLHPNRITILEVYADALAYQKHIQTKHFMRYKETVKEMVVSLELIDVNTIAFARKE